MRALYARRRRLRAERLPPPLPYEKALPYASAALCECALRVPYECLTSALLVPYASAALCECLMHLPRLVMRLPRLEAPI
jgi:hypothetical protein